MRDGAAIAIGVIILSASSFCTIPVDPVPITMQTFAVLVIGGLYGWRLGALTVCIWLAMGAAGLPVLADGASGLDGFRGPTAGYLLAFPIAAAAVGLLVRRGLSARWFAILTYMIIGHCICLLLGAAWLARTTGFEAAMQSGILPFIPGLIVKSLMASGVVRLLRNRVHPGAAPRS